MDVSAGFGHWLPIRFGVPREIVILTLRPANSAALAPGAG
jgi:predicted MPP superfamily phosphohydrolase